MPYFYDPNLQENEEQQGQGVQISGAGANVGPQSQGSGNAQGQPAAGQDKALKTGSGFQNLDKYLSSNAGQNFGDQFIGKAQDTVNQAQDQMSQAKNQFSTQVQDQNKTPTSEQVNSAIANPTGADPTQFQGWENQEYKGPKNLAENQSLYNQYWGGTNKANTTANLLNNEGGRFTLLDSYFGRPNYSFGEKSLDNLLVQGGNTGKAAKGIQTQAANLSQQGLQGQQELQNLASQTAGNVEQSKNSVRSAVGIDPTGQVITGEGAGALGQQYGAIEKALADQQTNRNAQNYTLQQSAQKGVFTPEQLQELGLSNGQPLYNLSLPDYFSYNNNSLTKENVMTPEQQAYIRALSGLAGVTDGYAANDLVQAQPSYTFNRDKFLGDATNQATELAKNQAQAQKELDNLNTFTGNAGGTADYWRNILATDPNNPNNDAIRQMLADLEKTSPHEIVQSNNPLVPRGPQINPAAGSTPARLPARGIYR